MFSDHPYISGINQPVVDHFEKLSKSIVSNYQLEPNSLVVDIGCNDGTLLNAFRTQGMRTLGVDPGSITGQLCREKGINVCQTFWNQSTGNALRSLNLIPDIITATAVFYHIPDIHDFIDGLKAVMNDQTVFITQCVNLKDVIEKNQFDHFYHEHTMIHAITPLKRLFESRGMRLLNVEFDPIHGGSFILHVGLSTCIHPTTKSVRDSILEEATAKLDCLETYKAFARRVERNRCALVELLKQLKSEGKTIHALCAPVKGSTLLNYCKIGPELVDKVLEINPHKIDRLTPGTHIPIVDERTIQDHPDYYLVLSWNFIDFFVQKYTSFLESGGSLIVPNPDVRIINKESLI
ncbi:MAG: class I SAM-dependent methyltransferase [Coraliomargarita sp.]